MKNNLRFLQWGRLFLPILIIIGTINTVHTQNSYRVTGKITDDNGPLAGVTIRIKGSSRGTTSDFDGNYSVQVIGSETLIYSFIGYGTVEEPINNRSKIDVILYSESTQLQEVSINAGYYKTTDKTKTGSIARISSAEIEKQPVNNPLEALQGRLTGVHITQSTGTAGGGFQVRIRGQNSIAAGNEPLYIVDGVPYDSGSLSYNGSSGSIMPGALISPLNALPPSSIASIEVLKDADATAIYGSRGANGVVLITTKNNTNDKTTFSVNVNVNVNAGFANISRKMKLMNTEQYLEMRRGAFQNDGITGFPFYAYDVNGTWDATRDVDWQDELLGGTAYIENYQGAVAGGSERTHFNIIGTYGKESTVFPKDFNYKRGTVLASINHSSSDDKFHINFTANYASEKNNQPGSDLSRSARSLAPNAPELYDESGNLNWENSTWTNPLAQLNGSYSNGIVSLISNATLSYELFRDFKISSRFGYTDIRIDEEKTNPHTIYNPAFGLTSANSNIFTNEGKRRSWIIEPQFNYQFNIGEGTFKTIFGFTFQEQNSEQFSLLGSGFTNNNLIYNLSAASNVFILDEKKNQYRYQAFFGRLNYNWEDKYIINVTGRRDGSSRFGPGKRYANFGAIGAAWVFSEEESLHKAIPSLSLGKLRASYGITGNDQIGDYQYFDTYSVSNTIYDGTVGLTPTRLFNPLFAWEKNRKFDLALDIGLWNNKLLLSSTYFRNTSSNQLVGVPLPGTTGFQNIQANLDATIRNSGWEFELHSRNIQKANFSWKSDFNLTIPKNELVSYEGLENSAYANRYVIGKPLTIVKLYHLEGVNPDTGLFEFEDFNNDGIISSPEDRQYTKDLAPKYYGGLTNTLIYKNMQLVLFFQYTKQNAYNHFFNYAPAGFMLNQPSESLNRWQKLGDDTLLQKYTSGSNFQVQNAFSKFAISDAVVTDASYIKLKNVSFSYQLPRKLLGNSDLLLTLQGQNLLTFTSFKGGDPEQIIGYLPQLRRFTMGVQFKF
ncbi:SusC/RagA family TonB-linked outer membrane protein [Aureibaculum sp. 2210JD6-5]|uniref:SusC/RagA family TonB-linked outer membrane protein n=1 Tax=Aureibaculum sp. 2210JD6-5 TaxID=3103957 RepID=UPI002AAD1A14|nr:SusC/RagA family TonB-linked outer membrane protein [Aureibaculum sp. 2210JD6-5]MDY7396856.1 SusC/RagA family TonB-linked outer membrane protein [Aureibaculum sp. 2210JD6-5]